MNVDTTVQLYPSLTLTLALIVLAAYKPAGHSTPPNAKHPGPFHELQFTSNTCLLCPNCANSRRRFPMACPSPPQLVSHVLFSSPVPSPPPTHATVSDDIRFAQWVGCSRPPGQISPAAVEGIMDTSALVPNLDLLPPAVPPLATDRGPFVTIHMSDYLDLLGRANAYLNSLMPSLMPPMSATIPQGTGLPAPTVLDNERAAPTDHLVPTVRESPGRKVACRNCHESRKTCDEGRPCGRCARRGEGASCVYVPRRRPKATQGRSRTTKNTINVDATVSVMPGMNVSGFEPSSPNGVR